MNGTLAFAFITLLMAVSLLFSGCSNESQSGPWVAIAYSDPITDTTGVSFRNRAISHNLGPIYESPELYITCWGPHPLIDSYGTGIHWGGAYVAAPGSRDLGKFSVQLRWDDGSHLRQDWSGTEDRGSTLPPHDTLFLRDVLRYEELRIRLWDFKRQPFEAQFELSGLRELIDSEPELCVTGR